MTTPAKQGELTLPELRSMVIRGDFSQLTVRQRDQFYVYLCDEHKLDWTTRPFEWLTLQGKLILYAKRDCTDQLRKMNGISIEIRSEKYEHGLLTIHVRATDKTGRSDEDFGVVPYGEKTAPEFAANLKMKAVTKAKRRVTLSISGLGMLDESEVEDIPSEAKALPAQQYRQPESGLQTTRTEAIALCAKVIAAVKAGKDSEAKQLALDMAANELKQIKQNFPDVYDRMQVAVAKDAEETGL